MNQEQAAEINRHLQRAANAIRRAEAIMWDLDQVDRKAFAEPLGNTVTALHFELLQVIYRQFPDLRPPDKGWRRIDSKLTWKQVQLPASITVMDFDRVILSAMSRHLRKTARIVADVSEQYRTRGIDLDPAIAAARLMAMAEDGLIEAEGDLRKWRYSEVRLRD